MFLVVGALGPPPFFVDDALGHRQAGVREVLNSFRLDLSAFLHPHDAVVVLLTSRS